MHRVKFPFATASRVFTVGTLVADSDPVVEGNLAFLEVVSEESVEQATAAPGEKRRTRRAPAAKVADKPAED